MNTRHTIIWAAALFIAALIIYATAFAAEPKVLVMDDGTQYTLTKATTAPSTKPTPKPFTVAGSKILDGDGKEFVIRGFNHTLAWGVNNLQALAEFPDTGCNAVRCCFGTTIGEKTPAQRQAVVEKLLASGIIPIAVEGFDGPTTTTGQLDPAPFRATVAHWRDVGNVAWLRQYPQTILNLANEWGPDSTVWRDEYIAAIVQLRAAGVTNLILCDSGNQLSNGIPQGPGSCPLTIQHHGAAVLAADPMRNVAFSIHMYSQWGTDDMPNEAAWLAQYPGKRWDAKVELKKIQDSGLCVIVGEFCNQNSTNPNVYYTPHRLMEVCQENGVGWLAWIWNQDSQSVRNMAVGWQYRSDADLKDWGRLVVDDPQYGLKATAKVAGGLK